MPRPVAYGTLLTRRTATIALTCKTDRSPILGANPISHPLPLASGRDATAASHLCLGVARARSDAKRGARSCGCGRVGGAARPTSSGWRRATRVSTALEGLELPALRAPTSHAQRPRPFSRQRDPCSPARRCCKIDAPDAHLELEFRFANIASRPRLRISRPRLRGTLRLHWEWISEYPYVGRVRWTFLRPPTVDAGLEPLGGVDVTQLPAVGPFIFSTMRSVPSPSAAHDEWALVVCRSAPLGSVFRITAMPARRRQPHPCHGVDPIYCRHACSRRGCKRT